MTKTSIENIVSLSKRRGFVYPGSEIYGGFGNSYTYGPYGVELKNNIKKLWWDTFVHHEQNIIGIDGDIILHPKVWEASGHAAGFSDQMVDCKNCHVRLRADHLIEEQVNEDAEGMSNEAMTNKIREKNIHCPKCNKKNFTEVRRFNLMFEIPLQKTDEKTQNAYLRPETAQAIFIEFKNIIDSTRQKIPFGIAQIGKAFRNEITPGNFIFRRLEFEQMEIEYFISPPPNFEKNRENYLAASSLEKWEPEDQKHVNIFFDQWIEKLKNWCNKIGLEQSRCHLVEHTSEKLSHYSKRTVDIEYDFPFGQKELYGLAYRTDFDLQQHAKYTKTKLQYTDPKTNITYVPHVIEPSFGLDRTILAVMCDAFKEEKLEDGTMRQVLRLKPTLAPVKCAILPLMKKDGLPEKSREIFKHLAHLGNIEYDESGAVGKRYRRQDEIGTPLCITIDYETLDDESVTIRNRDNMAQERIKITELEQKIREKIQ